MESKMIQSHSKRMRYVGRLAFIGTLSFAYFAMYANILNTSKRSLDVLMPATKDTAKISKINLATSESQEIQELAQNTTVKISTINPPKPQEADLKRPPLKIPFPVLVASIFKSGTTSIHSYFQCGKQRSVHYFGVNKLRTGVCMLKNVSKRRSIFQGCGPYDIWTDNNAMEGCWDPSVFALDAFYMSHPNATIILSTRDPDDWIQSVKRWGGLMDHLKSCKHLWPQQPKRNRTENDIRDFYIWQIDHVRSFAAAHPSLTFIEFSLDDNEAGYLLEKKIGIPSSCWGRQNTFATSRFSESSTDSYRTSESHVTNKSLYSELIN